MIHSTVSCDFCGAIIGPERQTIVSDYHRGVVVVCEAARPRQEGITDPLLIKWTALFSDNAVPDICPECKSDLEVAMSEAAVICNKRRNFPRA